MFQEFFMTQLQSKRFHEEITVDDFPLRGKAVNSISNAEDGQTLSLAKSYKETGISSLKGLAQQRILQSS